ncbi:MAG: DUF1552 domain-containing protein [Planctomycetaceae bacterium]|nr:DUF1552 domain-containing protein [Planctomycetaceae bacterium]
MQAPGISVQRSVSRRTLLRGAAASAIGLPLLEAMTPAVACRSHSRAPAPKRFVAMCAGLGFHGPHLFPETAGTDYELTPYLSRLKDHRDHFTVLSGLSHPNQQGNNGHASELTWLTSAPRPGLAGFRNTVSLDQLIAEQAGLQTRFPWLALSTSGRSMSWTSSGVEIPGETSPAKLFRALFMEGTPQEVAAEMRQLQKGRSILDTVLRQAKSLDRELSRHDRRKMDEYLTAVRDLESRLQQSQGWSKRPKPAVDSEPPQDITDKTDAIGRQRLMYDMIVLALQTDSTRTVTFQLSGMNAVPKIAGVSHDWHNLSHHGKDQEKIDELKVIEEAEFETFNEFLGKLRAVSEEQATLLDNTVVLFGSNLGNASSHSWRNLPVIVAGGGYRHAGYVAHDEKNNVPLANLFVSIAQQVGVQVEKFGSSTASSVAGLEAG